jgi:predicted nucleic acid-binding Zn finger protein
MVLKSKVSRPGSPGATDLGTTDRESGQKAGGRKMAKVMDGPRVTVAGSNGAKYQVWALGSKDQWCTCPSYKYQRLPVSQRECKHTEALKAAGVVMEAAK